MARERGRSFGGGVPTPFQPEPEDAGAQPAGRPRSLPTIIPSGYVPLVPLRATGSLIGEDGEQTGERIHVFAALLSVEGVAIYVGVDPITGKTILVGQDRARVYLDAHAGDLVDSLAELARSSRDRS